MSIIAGSIARCIVIVAHVVAGYAQCEDELMESSHAFSALQKMLVMERARPEEQGIRVVGAGQSRTGTESLAAALRILGYNPSHGEEFKMPGPYPKNMDSVDKARRGQPEDMLSVLISERVDSVFDGPLNEFYPLYRERYGAKTILSVHPRGTDGWVESYLKYARYCNLITPFPVYREFLGHGSNGCIFPTAPNATIADMSSDMLAICKSEYEDYNADVIKNVPPGELLLYNVTQGWGPLCEFLGKPVPTVEFPRVDIVEDTRKKLCKCGLRCPGMVIAGRGKPKLPDDEALIPGDAFDDCP